jgi:hypothetical protein
MNHKYPSLFKKRFQMSISLRCLLILLLLPALHSNTRAQNFTATPQFLKANSHWMVPLFVGTNDPNNGLGIDFNTNPPTELYQTQYYGESCVAVSDTGTGDLLFYSDGETCWNANYQPMPNGTGLTGQNSANQVSLAVPVLDTPGKYYLFYIQQYFTPSPTLSYSVVDMSLDNGLGDIDPARKNIQLDAGPLQESMVAIPGNNCDVWVLVHPYYDTVIKAFHITSAGVDPNPVISSPGSMIGGATAAFELGSMSVSPDRSMIAITSYSLGCIALGLTPGLGGVMTAKFDATTGLVSDGIRINDSMAAYSTCFSPDNSKLYAQGITADSVAVGNMTEFPPEVHQFDVSSYVQADIINSRQIVYVPGVNPDHQLMNMRRRGDTIYLTNFTYITNPNLSGAACGFQTTHFIPLAGFNAAGFNGATFNFGNDVIYPLPPDTTRGVVLDTMFCKGQIALEAASSFSNYVWDNGSTNMSRQVDQTGTYWVKYGDGCHSRVDTFIVNIPNLEAIITVNVFDLGTTQPYTTYQWLFNSSIIPGATNSIYTVPQNGGYQVVVTDANGCNDTSDVYTVTNVGVDGVEAIASQIEVYPNPSKDYVTIKSPVSINIILSSVDGRKVLAQEHATRISVGALADGVYMLKITDQEGKLIKTEKLIKSH